jgi:hypothetical protein
VSCKAGEPEWVRLHSAATGEELSHDERAEIMRNLLEFFELLGRWAEDERAEAVRPSDEGR